MKFRKKPVVIDAERWYPPDSPHHIPISGVQLGARDITEFTSGGRRFYINTLEGVMEVSSGDWIITGVKGEKYPCKPDIFEASYEPA